MNAETNQPVNTLSRQLLIKSVRGYQKILSPVLGCNCRFHPSCSHYAIEAIDRHGSILGLGLTMWRLLRCNPLSDGGHDPVPLQLSFFSSK